MKRLVLGMVALVFTISTFAQETKKEQKSPAEMATKRVDKLKVELGLSEEQRGKLYTAMVDKISKSQAIRAKYGDDKKSAQQEMKPLKQAFETTVKGILTPEQFAKWEELKAKQKQKHKEKKGGKGK